IVFIRSLQVEIQVRTQLQHQWAELYEKLADKIGRGIRYGEAPEHWLTSNDRGRLSNTERYVHERLYHLWSQAVVTAHAIARAIDVYERKEFRDPQDSGLRDAREAIDSGLRLLSEMLDELAAIPGGPP